MTSLSSSKTLEKAQMPINGAFAIMKKYIYGDDNAYRVTINDFAMPLRPWA